MSECRVVPKGVDFEGKQGLSYLGGVSAESVGAIGLCMHIVEIPPGARANAHYHESHETAIYMLEGVTEMLYGPELEHHLRLEEGEFLYIPAGTPHLPYNPGPGMARAVLSRTDPNEQESVVLCPELDSVSLPGLAD